MTQCPTDFAMVEPRIDRVLTQYRESPKLLHLTRVYLRKVEEVAQAICAIPTFFDLDTAVGDQLTLIGKRMGWPRCHCVCNVQPVFGFQCDGFDNGYTIVGFCDENGQWADCGPFGTSDICITDDEAYRGFLKARRYQMLALFDIGSLTAAVQHLFGAQATVLSSGLGRVVIAPNRVLTRSEESFLQLYPRVLPVAPGIAIRFHFGPLRVFGFGEGWGSFCEEWQPDGLPLVTETGAVLVTETGEEIFTGPLTRDAPFMCEIDPRPYDCA